jgi:molybdopterin-containing oxidoreductase family iron-sulfur binding subunit
VAELENSPEFEAFLQREFPVAASEFPQGVSRRRWLQLMGASLALGGLAGCRYREEKITPLSARPQDWVPGEPQKYATSIQLAGAPRHLLVTCYDGRPIKVEGNPDHAYSRGATDALAQACILDLYDPDRSGRLRLRDGGQEFDKQWPDFAQVVSESTGQWKGTGGEGLAILVEPTESAAVHEMLRAAKAAFPKAELFGYAPISRDNEHEGSELAFGKVLRTHFALDQAQIIVCLDADLLGNYPASVRMARDFVTGRDPEAGRINRLYAVESQYSTTGVMADHRLAIRSSDIGGLLADLEQRVVQLAAGGQPQRPGRDQEKREQMLRAMASDLLAHRGKSAIAVGPRQPAAVHAVAHRLNSLLGNVGNTVLYTDEPTERYAVELGDLVALVDRMKDGSVDTLLILGGNPVYDAPSDLGFAGALGGVDRTIHLSVYDNETSQQCRWHLPQTHPLESWGDSPAYDGTICVSQPLVEPLLDGKSAIELLAMFVGDTADGQAIVRRALDSVAGGSLTDEAWRRLLHDGFLADSSLEFVTPESQESDSATEAGPVEDDELELVFHASDAVYDGRFANNGWLQETPGLLTKLTWDNVALINPSTARDLGVEHATLVRLEVGAQSVEIPAFVLPGQAAGSIGVALGYGRTAAGLVGGSEADGVQSVGVDVTPLRTTSAMYVATGVTVTPLGVKYPLATTQDHHAIDKVGFEAIGHRVGEFIRQVDYEHYREHPDAVQHMGGHHPPLESLWEEASYDGYAWGMSIDLNKCIGCNACLVACQSENNVPIVGKDQVLRGREMHWLRLDRYFWGEGPEDEDLQVAHQPLACHHCELAPCEQVCPVAATVHSDEGLNDMVYNRCIGTRYCANNCPYKVRRFNFFNNAKHLEDANRQLVQLAINPEVTVRSRGVMEKCTYCVQRIQNAKIDARNEGRPIRPNDELQTACQQACPTRAIEFGDLNNESSRVAKLRQSSRSYGLLTELNVKPRTTYLARIRNPHPDLAAEHHHEGPSDTGTGEHGHG